MESWVPAFIAWHVATEHPWDLALHLEAVSGYIREDLEAIMRKVFHDLFEDGAFSGLRVLVV